MQFVGKDFLSMPAPPGYKAGVGRGAVGFSTTAERGGGDDSFPARAAARGKAGSPGAARDRFADANGTASTRAKRENAEAEAIYAAVETRLAASHAKRKQRPEAAPDLGAPLKSDLTHVSIDEWASLPEASDLTHRNKRLREDERALKRNYAVPDTLILAQQDEEQRLADLRRRRLMLESMIRAEPRNPEGFLALARLEQQAARHKKARVIIEKGTLVCPQSPEIWLASIEMHPNSTEARAIAAKGCRACPESEQLWLRAVALEPTDVMKAQVTHEALLHCSLSAQLWLLAVRFEEDVQAKLEILRTAVEFLPDNEDIWTALIERSGADEYNVLLEASQKCPHSRHIWLLTAQKSEGADLEHHVQKAVVDETIPRHELIDMLLALPPEDSHVAAALARSLKVSASELSEKHITPEMQSLIYSVLPKSEHLYIEWAKSDPKVLERAVQEFPQSSRLWSEYIAAGGDVQAALEKCEELSSDTLLPVAVENLLLRGRKEAAIALLRSRASGSPVLLARLVEIYEVSGRLVEALDTVNEGISRWPETAELYLAKSRLDADHALGVLREGLNRVPTSDEKRRVLWRELSLKSGSSIARRAVLSQAIGEYSDDGALWLQRILLEKHAGLPVAHVIEEALRSCASYGLLWWEAILAAPPPRRKAKLVEAVKLSKGDIYVLLAGALMFAGAGQREKAGEWFMKAHARDPNNGDIILWMSKYELASDELITSTTDGAAQGGLTWSNARRLSIIREEPVTNAFHATAARLDNPFITS